jgi:hypothetical protein
MEHGAKLGQLWMENQFEVGDPLTNHGSPQSPRTVQKGKSKKR